MNDTIILKRCPSCGRPSEIISLYDAQTNYFKTQRGETNYIKSTKLEV